MAYVDPNKVLSPQRSVSNLRVIWNGGQWAASNPTWSGWSVCELDWDGNSAVGARWNGADGEPGVGNPQSRGLPTWFILPDGIADAVLQTVTRHRDGDNAAQPDAPVSPRRRLLDLIAYVRTASDEELTKMLAQMDILGPTAGP